MIGVLVSGSGSNLQALLDAGLPVNAVASNNAQAFALERAGKAGVAAASFPLDAFATRVERDEAMAEWLVMRDVELVVCAGYMHLLSPSFLDRFASRVINVHPSLLPAFPGMSAIEDALAAGVTVTGATVHYVDEGVDTGPVIEQVEVAIADDDTVESLRERVQALEHRLLPQVTGRLVEELRSAARR